jgi:prepilin-type N-terminal cleavage/methylation domain-containing protein
MHGLGFRPRAGFTLVEIMVVLLIVSVLATIGIPALSRLKEKSKTAVLIGDARVFATAFDTYSHEFGSWPADAAAGVMPTGMSGRLTDAWLRTTPMGGKYNWEYNQLHFGTRITAAIGISATAAAPLPLDVNQLLSLERTADPSEYNLLGGSFRIGTGIIPLFVVQQ